MEMQDRIKAIRKHVNMTQAEFATSLGLGPYSAAAWEKKDAQIPTESMQLLICKTFGIDLHWLKTGEGEMFAGKSADEIAIENALRDVGGSTALRAFLSAWSRLNDANRAVLDKFVDDYVAEYQSRAAAESVARDETVFDEPDTAHKPRCVPIIGTALNDGSWDAKLAAHQEQRELQQESLSEVSE